MTHWQPRVSIIVAVYNGAATLQRCLDSIAGQSYPHLQLILIDGGSTDGTLDLLKEYQNQFYYWESQPDRGIYHAWNKGLMKATGDWVCFVGADDFFWTEDALECLVPHLSDAYPEKRIVYSRIAVVSQDGQFLRYEGQSWEASASTFTRAMNLPHPGLMHHRSVFQEYGGFDESLRICADYDLLLRELPAHPACFVPDVVTLGVQHGGISYAPAAMGTMLRELDYIRHKHGLKTPGLWNSPSVLWKMRLCALATQIAGEKGFRRLAALYRRGNRSRRAVFPERQGSV